MEFNYQEKWEQILKDVGPPPSSSGPKPPVYFIFSGMGSQYLEMGKELYEKIPDFRESIQTSAIWIRFIYEEILPEEEALELLDLIFEGTEETFKNVLHSFVAITAIQLALEQCLRNVGIVPTGIIGHSIGEFASAVADKSLTFIEGLFISFAQGYAILKTSEARSEKGAMATVVGSKWEQVRAECPEGVWAACQNGPNIVTIAGSESKLANYQARLESKGLTVLDVETSGQAFHCPYMEPAAKLFEEILVKAKGKNFGMKTKRSEKWISTSVPENRKGEEWAQNPGVKYWVNNMIGPVLFHDAVKNIPENAVVIEIAPHSLLLPILKRALPGRAFVGLMDKNNKNHPELLLKNMGILYSKGLNPDIECLFHFKDCEKQISELMERLRAEENEEN